MKRAVAGLLALLQLAWSLSGGCSRVWAQAVAANVSGRTGPAVRFTALGRGPQTVPNLGAGLFQPLPSLASLRTAPRVLPPQVLPAAGPVPQLQSAVQAVGQALEAAGLRPEAPAESARDAADAAFAALVGERRIPGAETVSAYGVAVQESASGLQPVSKAAADPDRELLADLTQNPPRAVFFDYDKTLTTPGSEGLNTRPDEAAVRALSALLGSGIPVGLVTARSLDHASENEILEDDIFRPLVGRIPKALRRNLYFSGQMGSEVAMFDERGEIVRVQEAVWSRPDRAAIDRSAAYCLHELGIKESELMIVRGEARSYIRFPEGDSRAPAFAEMLSARLAAQGLRAQTANTGAWVMLSKFNKEDGIRQLYTAMLSRGHALTESSLLLVADDFHLPRGGDAAMASAFPKSRAISVGDAPGAPLPANVRRISADYSAGSVKVIGAVLQGAPKISRPGFWSRPRGRGVLWFTAGAAAALLVPLAAAHVGMVAAAGSVTLSLIGLPQIWRLYKSGRDGARDLAAASTRIWFAAAVLLAAVSIGQGSNVWWNAANLAGAAESGVVLGQISVLKGDHREVKRTVLAAAAVLAPLPLMCIPVLLPLSAWLSVAFWAAMALLWVLNWPQIRQNYRLFQAEGRAPQGISPLYPGLVVAGSLMHLYAALAGGDLRWAMNASIAVLTASLVLGQIYAPKIANALVAPLVKLADRAKKVLAP